MSKAALLFMFIILAVIGLCLLKPGGTARPGGGPTEVVNLRGLGGNPISAFIIIAEDEAMLDWMRTC